MAAVGGTEGVFLRVAMLIGGGGGLMLGSLSGSGLMLGSLSGSGEGALADGVGDIALEP